MATKIRRIIKPVVGSSLPSLVAISVGGNGSCWDIGPSQDLLDIIWSFTSITEQCTTIVWVCQRWNTLNRKGFGWNTMSNEKILFQLHELSQCKPLPSVMYSLLNHRWQHLTSLHMLMGNGTDFTILIQPKLMINVRHIHLEYPGLHLMHAWTAHLLDELMQFTKLETLSLSGGFGMGEKVPHPTHGWSSCSSLTSLSFTLDKSEFNTCNGDGSWNNIKHLSLDGTWSIGSIHSIPHGSLPSLTSLSLRSRGASPTADEIIPLLRASSSTLTSLSISNINVSQLKLLVPYFMTLEQLNLDSLHSDHPDQRSISFLMSLLQLIPSVTGAQIVAHGDDEEGGDEKEEAANLHDELTSVKVPSLSRKTAAPSLSKPNKVKHSKGGSKSDIIATACGPLTHLGLSAASFLPHQDLLPLVNGLSLFTITDGSQELIKWITTNVKNGSLPLLQRCHILDVSKVGSIWRPITKYLSYHRHQILNDAMLTLIKSTKVAKTTLPRSLSPSSSSKRSLQSMALLIALISANPIIMDNLFSYLNAFEKWFIIEPVCRSWLGSSKILGCGWKSFSVGDEHIPYDDKIRSLFWFKLIGMNRLSRQRHISASIEECGPSFSFVHRYFTRLTSLSLYGIAYHQPARSLSPEELLAPLY
jgi:hypothetical protein